MARSSELNFVRPSLAMRYGYNLFLNGGKHTRQNGRIGKVSGAPHLGQLMFTIWWIMIYEVLDFGFKLHKNVEGPVGPSAPVRCCSLSGLLLSLPLKSKYKDREKMSTSSKRKENRSGSDGKKRRRMSEPTQIKEEKEEKKVKEEHTSDVDVTEVDTMEERLFIAEAKAQRRKLRVRILRDTIEDLEERLSDLADEHESLGERVEDLDIEKDVLNDDVNALMETLRQRNLLITEMEGENRTQDGRIAALSGRLAAYKKLSDALDNSARRAWLMVGKMGEELAR